MNSKLRGLILVVLVVALMAGAASSGYYLGSQRPQTVVVKGIDNIQSGTIKNANFNTFWQTWQIIKDNYLKADKINDQQLIYGAAGGLVDSLDDPYTVFLDPVESKKFADDIKGSFGGIGAEIGFRGDFIVVIAPLKDTPAERAGLKAGDKILAINDTAAANLNLNEIVKLIRGPKGTQVTLTILSNSDEKPREVQLIREIIKVPTLQSEIKDKNIVHIRLFNFSEAAPHSLANALNVALRQGVQGIILDLRNNPGGFLEAAVSIAGIFIERGEVVAKEEFRSGKTNLFPAQGNPVLKDFPLIVLINKGSASASEILAGALRDHNGTIIIGEKSFGKGTVQELKSLPDGSTVKITIARWLLPKGSAIDGDGVKPDIEIALSEKDVEAKKDPPLEKAIEILKSKIAAQS